MQYKRNSGGEPHPHFDRATNHLKLKIIGGELDETVSMSSLEREASEVGIKSKGLLDAVGALIKADEGLLHYHMNKGVEATEKARQAASFLLENAQQEAPTK